MTLVSPSVYVDSVLGIDVAKAKVDTWFQRVTPSQKPTHQRYDNTPAGHQRLLAWLASQAGGQLHVCLEATGTYSDALALCLHQAGYRVSLVNPLRIKRYGESELRRIKTDKSDAALIARFCLTQQPDPWTPPPPEQRELQDLVRSLQDVKHLSQQQVSRQQSGPHTPPVAHTTTCILTCLQEQRKTLETHITHHILAHESLAADYALLLSIVSIGPKTAAVLLAELGDVRRFANVRDLVAYVGLCPRLCSSGSSLHGPPVPTSREWCQGQFIGFSQIKCKSYILFHYDMSWEITYRLWRWERFFERKGVRSFSVGTQVGQALFCLLNSGNVA